MEIAKCVRLRSIVLFFIIINTALSDILPSIIWSTENPFLENLGGQARTVFFKNKFYFVCPNNVQYTVKTNTPMNKDILYANIYMVNKQGYESCNATGGLKIMLCDKPTELKSTSVLINNQAAVQSIPVFQIGKTNYFIDTSSGTEDTIDNLVGGRCNTHNMKMKIYVCTGPSDSKCPSGNQVVNGGWSAWGECKLGSQSRQCNNPSPANGGFTCEGNSTQLCTQEIKPTVAARTTSGTYNHTFTPMKGKRSSEENDLGSLGAGETVAIFLAVFVFGCVLGVLLGVLVTHKKLKQFVVKRRKVRSNNNANRNSSASTNNYLRPASFASILSNATGITNFDGPEHDNLPTNESVVI